MQMLPTDKNTNDTDDLFFKQPTLVLAGEEQWFYLQKRYRMSPREIEVAKLVCQGFNNDRIAKFLRITHGTVKTHIRNIYRRVRVKNKITLLLKLVEDSNGLCIKPETREVNVLTQD